MRRSIGFSLLLAALTAQLTSCAAWQMRYREATPDERITIPKPDLSVLGMRSIIVVEFFDRTEQGAGRPIAETVSETLSAAGLPVSSRIIPRPGERIPATWFATQSQQLGVQGFITGTVSAYTVQSQQKRVFLVLTGLLLDNQGEIRWSRRLAAAIPLALASNSSELRVNMPEMGNNKVVAPLATGQEAGHSFAALAVAVRTVAKEFVNDLVSPP